MKQLQWKSWQLYWHNFNPQSYLYFFILKESPASAGLFCFKNCDIIN